MLQIPVPAKELISRAMRASVFRPVLAMQGSTAEAATAITDASYLRAERDSLAAALVGYATLSAENRELRALVGLRGRLPRQFVAAEVIHVQSGPYEGAFLVNAGQRNGVRGGMPIVSAEGLVGRVVRADERSALAMDWTHPDFRVSAITPDGETYGIVLPQRGPRDEQMLALTGTPFHAKLRPGTMIVTSGRGGVYPRGIPIGTIVGPGAAQAGMSKSYLVRPFVQPSEASHVMVLGDPAENAADQDLALAWGIRVAETDRTLDPPTDFGVRTTQPATPTRPGTAAGTASGTRPTVTRRPGATATQPVATPGLLGVPGSPAQPDSTTPGEE